MREGMPRDVDELLRIYQATIRKAVGCDVWSSCLIAHHLWCRGVLARFRLPEVVTHDQAILYLGIQHTVWRAASRKRPHVLPVPVEGTVTSMKARYRFSDLHALYEKRDALFSRTAKGGFFESMLPGLGEFIVAESLKIAEEMKAGYIYDVPDHLPQSFTELTAEYMPAVVKTVRFKLRFGMEVPDAINEVLAKLYKSDPVAKFVRGAVERLPTQMTVDDVLDYLGIEWPQWQRMMRSNRHAPNPVKGEAMSQLALYAGDDIRALEATGYFKKQGMRFLPNGAMTKEHFDRYMKRSIDYALQNVFRNNDRHFNREDTLSEGACIRDNRVRTLRREEMDVPWEDSLTSDGISAEVLVDIKRRAEIHQVQVEEA